MARKNLAELAGQPVLSAPVPSAPSTVPIERVAPNPLNPREELGDLTELVASLQTIGQLQPCTVVTRAAYLTQYPEHEVRIGACHFVAVTGGRRRVAAEQAGLPTLDVVVKDAIAESRETLARAAIAENIERRNFDVLEEARAVAMLVEICGDGVRAAEHLARSKGWVSQRLALLKLVPELQQLVRAGELPVREARRLGGLPAEEQIATWRAEQIAASSAVAAATEPTDQHEEPQGVAIRAATAAASGPSRDPLSAAVRKLGKSPAEIAGTLQAYLDAEVLDELGRLLNTSAAS